MNKITLIVSSIIIALVIFVAGGGLGVFYQAQKDAPQLEKTTAVLKNPSSKVISTATAYGKVEKIEGKNITLSYGGDSIVIGATDNTKVYSYSDKSARQEVEYSTIKKGDNIDITIKILPDGGLNAEAIFILPNFAKTSPASK